MIKIPAGYRILAVQCFATLTWIGLKMNKYFNWKSSKFSLRGSLTFLNDLLSKTLPQFWVKTNHKHPDLNF